VRYRFISASRFPCNLRPIHYCIQNKRLIFLVANYHTVWTHICEPSLVEDDEAAPFGLVTRKHLEQPTVDRNTVLAVILVMVAYNPEVRACGNISVAGATARTVSTRTFECERCCRALNKGDAKRAAASMPTVLRLVALCPQARILDWQTSQTSRSAGCDSRHPTQITTDCGDRFPRQ